MGLNVWIGGFYFIMSAPEFCCETYTAIVLKMRFLHIGITGRERLIPIIRRKGFASN